MRSDKNGHKTTKSAKPKTKAEHAADKAKKKARQVADYKARKVHKNAKQTAGKAKKMGKLAAEAATKKTNKADRNVMRKANNAKKKADKAGRKADATNAKSKKGADKSAISGSQGSQGDTSSTTTSKGDKSSSQGDKSTTTTTTAITTTNQGDKTTTSGSQGDKSLSGSQGVKKRPVLTNFLQEHVNEQKTMMFVHLLQSHQQHKQGMLIEAKETRQTGMRALLSTRSKMGQEWGSVGKFVKKSAKAFNDLVDDAKDAISELKIDSVISFVVRQHERREKRHTVVHARNTDCESLLELRWSFVSLCLYRRLVQM